jgi:hypothetical protein
MQCIATHLVEEFVAAVVALRVERLNHLVQRQEEQACAHRHRLSQPHDTSQQHVTVQKAAGLASAGLRDGMVHTEPKRLQAGDDVVAAGGDVAGARDVAVDKVAEVAHRDLGADKHRREEEAVPEHLLREQGDGRVSVKATDKYVYGK